MSPIKFFTPISYEKSDFSSLQQKMTQTVDSYFYLGGKKAYDIDLDEKYQAHLLHSERSLFTTALKIVSYFTVILPLIALVAKWILRSSFDFPQLDLNVGISPFATETLGFDLDEVKRLIPKKTILIHGPKTPQIEFDKKQTMRKIVDTVIEEINNAFIESIKTKRVFNNKFAIETWKTPYAGNPNERSYLGSYNTISTTGNRCLREPTILQHVLGALQEKRYLTINNVYNGRIVITLLNRQ